MTTQEAYARWWANEGSAMSPLPDEDVEEFSRRITQNAWSNGSHVEREECAKVAEKSDAISGLRSALSIRLRSQQ
jgi:hypothetical protein